MALAETRPSISVGTASRPVGEDTKTMAVREEVKKKTESSQRTSGVLEEEKKLLAPSPIAEEKKKKSLAADIKKLTEILKDVKGKRLPYKTILRIGHELEVCQVPPTLIFSNVLTRPMRGGNRQPSPYQPSITRREKTEEEKRIDEDAKMRREFLNEAARLSSDKEEFMDALNKLTPNNFVPIAEKIWTRKEKSKESSDTLVDCLFKKTWKESTYIGIYAKLCKEIISRESQVPFFFHPIDRRKERSI